ncbi:cell wall-active antibiotics response protein LiaF [Falsibacillus albus]|uniref:Cell wall-active antibiotics response protein n=1 Tax=Falsibacillus albus TaxID=2478915 RepID=A0A3L7JXB6_9BACI|nr:cell wall-active antibiotics response protein LiaF [Falsibacillus albus]RLQ93082.1 cell wall-active antibiotics response protein [Falsibacillus albus]
MMDKLKGDGLSWIILIGILLLVFELSFHNGDAIFSLLVAGGLIYLGKKKKDNGNKRNLFFWIGIIILIVTIFNLVTFRLLIIAIIGYAVIQFAKSKQEPKVIKPKINLEKKPRSNEAIYIKTPYFKNQWFGSQATVDHPFEWEDINIQAGVGDTIIDLSNTVLPNGEAVIFIKNLIGNIKILVPYETEISIRHSVVAGASTIFQHQEHSSFNHTVHFQTEGYEQAEQKVKVITSLLVGNIEVKRV